MHYLFEKTDFLHKNSEKSSNFIKIAGVAQQVEHLTRNEKVTCSNHATSSIKKSVSCGCGFLLFNSKGERK